jgi:hypothetical protein
MTEDEFRIALTVYKGEVPKSPKTIPSVMSRPAKVTPDAVFEEKCFMYCF